VSIEEFEFVPAPDPSFVGMHTELNWLDEHLLNPPSRQGTTLLITGVGGVGKTTLMRQWLSSRRQTSMPLWVDLHSRPDASSVLDEFRAYLYAQRNRREFIVVLDGTEDLSEEQHQRAIGSIFNFKAVRSLVVITRRSIRLEHAVTLSLGPLSLADATELLKKLLPADLTPELTSEVVTAAQGYTLAIRLLANVFQSGNADTLREFLRGPLYDLSRIIAVPSTEIVTAVAPTIITARSALIDALRKQPAQIHSLSPRKFEELLAELLSDMGWEVELTKETRDGGKDILAYLNTGLGRLLCLVEAKHYRKDRKVGVELVRTLYGTLCDAEANSAMLVTSSSFSPEAQEFQKRHSYRLALHDYADVVNWILKYGNARKNG
jgi:restriction system protein